MTRWSWAGCILWLGPSFLVLTYLGRPAAADAGLCAELAAGIYEAGVERGVPFADIDAERAIPACREAVAADSSDVPSSYRLGRALGAAGSWEDALPMFRRGVEAGYAPSFAALGYMYLNGTGVAQDDAAALELYSRAHELGDPSGAENLAWMYYNGVGVQADPARAADLFRDAIAGGSSEAEFRLGNLLWYGDGVPEDRAEAVRLFRSAAARGVPGAQAELSVRLMSGDGVERDDAEAARLAALAAEGGDAYGAYLHAFALEHGRGVERDLQQAAHWYGESATAGNPNGANAYARLLEAGRGVAADAARARAHYLTAAEAGLPDAQARLGRLLRIGSGGPRDLAAARGWLERAGEQPIALYHLGLMTWNGEDGPEDRPNGLQMIRRAADGGLADAQVEAARILTTATGGEPFRDEAAAVAYLGQAAAQDHLDALAILGMRLIDGEGVAKDVDRGLAMLDEAAARGDLNAAAQATIQRRQMELEATMQGLRAEQCQLMIELCNRGCEEQEDGSYIYNTYDGKLWFHANGRLIPQGEAPEYGCPQ